MGRTPEQPISANASLVMSDVGCHLLNVCSAPEGDPFAW